MYYLDIKDKNTQQVQSMTFASDKERHEYIIKNKILAKMNCELSFRDEKEPLQVRAKVAAIIREAREKNGWTRYELAKRSGMSEAHIMRIEHGLYAIRVDIFNNLCKALGIECVFPIS